MSRSEPHVAADSSSFAGGDAVRLVPTRAGAPIPYGDVLSLWAGDASFRGAFARLLADAPFPAFRFETPPVTRATAGRPFECVLLRSDRLERPPDPTPFAAPFAAGGDADVIVFDNIGRDARMVVPRPRGDETAYVHLARFLRHAPAGQVDRLWRTVGETMREELGPAPRWLNTEGSGVAWLHVRIDTRPKYYGHAPYARLD